MKTKIYKEFIRTGKMLFKQGVISLTAGNMSRKIKKDMYITASGSMLGDLKKSDIVHSRTGRDRPKKASVEYKVHQEIYNNTGYRAIIHTHPPNTLVVAEKVEIVKPIDAEGKLYIPEVPVVEVDKSIGSKEVAGVIPGILKNVKAVIIKDHGVFSVSDTIAGAAGIVSTLEFSSKILFKKKIFTAGI